MDWTVGIHGVLAFPREHWARAYLEQASYGRPNPTELECYAGTVRSLSGGVFKYSRLLRFFKYSRRRGGSFFEGRGEMDVGPMDAADAHLVGNIDPDTWDAPAGARVYWQDAEGR